MFLWDKVSRSSHRRPPSDFQSWCSSLRLSQAARAAKISRGNASKMVMIAIEGYLCNPFPVFGMCHAPKP